MLTFPPPSSGAGFADSPPSGHDNPTFILCGCSACLFRCLCFCFSLVETPHGSQTRRTRTHTKKIDTGNKRMAKLPKKQCAELPISQTCENGATPREMASFSVSTFSTRTSPRCAERSSSKTRKGGLILSSSDTSTASKVAV